MTNKDNEGRVEAVGVDTLGIPRKKHKGMRNSQPLDTRKFRSHTASSQDQKGLKNSRPLSTRSLRSHTTSRNSNQSGINEYMGTGDISNKVTEQSSECSNHEACQTRSNELPTASTKFHVWSNEGINLFVDLKLAGEACIRPEMLNVDSRVLHHTHGDFRESEEQTKFSALGNTSVNLINTTGDPEVIESSPSSVVSGILEENISSSATTPKNVAESSLVRESDPKVSSLCGAHSQNSVDLSSDSHLQSGNIPFVSAGSKLSDISEQGSTSYTNSPASAETAPMPALVSSNKTGLPIVSEFCEDRNPLIASVLENAGGVNPPPSEPLCPEPLVEDQVELVNNSAGSASQSDIQLDNGIQPEPPLPELPVEDQVELVNSSDLGSASQPDLQPDNSIQSEPPCPEPLVEDQVELVNNSASWSVTQPVKQLDNGIQYGRITSQQAEDPTNQQATEEHAELHSHGNVAPMRGMLKLPMSIGRSLGGNGTCVSDSGSMGGVPDSINHSPQSALTTSSRTSQSMLRQDPTLNESVRISKEQGQVGLVINSAPQPNTRLDYGIQVGHNTCQRAEFPTQPATTVDRSELPSYSDALRDTVLQLPMFVGGNGTRVSDARSLGVLPQCISHPLQISPMTSSQTLHEDDPFSYEVARLRQEYDQAVKFHEETNSRLRFGYYREVQELQRKYSLLQHENDLAFARTTKALQANYSKVFMNRLLAMYFREKDKLL